ncbi:MAG: Cytosine/purine/uracil/thiamine/allantoin permease family protein [Myxococcaceae bacterium]|nr:Cytosine/purine/uracil/thiamine/allantoin permease family protein [Myxococcaceae bacterium]
MAIVSLIGVGIATLSVNIAANVVSPANDFANLAPRLISFKTGGLITGLLGIAMMPWKLLASADTYIFNWLVGYSALLGPIAGIMIADYWVLRRRELDVPDLYRPTGRYAGVNWIALGALVIGILPNVPGFLKSAHLIEGPENFFDQIYVYAWFNGFLLAFGLYLAGMKTLPRRLATAPTSGLVLAGLSLMVVGLIVSWAISGGGRYVVATGAIGSGAALLLRGLRKPKA